MNPSVRDVLFLLTADYPFGSKETYLDGEIPFLARRFETVLIWSGAKDRSQARPLPGNVVVVDPIPARTRSPFAVQIALLRAAVSELWTTVVRYRLIPRRSFLSGMWRFLKDATRIALGMRAELTGRGIDPGRVVAYSYWAMETAMACAVLKGIEPRMAAVTRAHGYDVYFERHRPAYRPFRRHLVTTLDRFYVVSGHGAAYTEGKLGSHLSTSIQVRYLGAKGPARPFLEPTHSGPFVILTCAALIPLKRIDLFIDALAEAVAALPEQKVHWRHYGGGPLQQSIEAHAAAVLGGIPRLSYDVAGQVPHGVITDHLSTQHVDLFVSASQWEGLPVSMMEAMACGIPVVTTDVGGCSEIVRDGVNGFVVSRDPGPRELGRAIRTYMELGPDAKASFRRAARATWQQSFDFEANYADFAAELGDLP